QLDGALNLNIDNVVWNTGSFSGSGTLNLTRGTMSWSAGSLASSAALNVSAGAALFPSNSAAELDGTINNSGTFGGSFFGMGGGTFNNLAGGYFNGIQNIIAESGSTQSLIRNFGTMAASF